MERNDFFGIWILYKKGRIFFSCSHRSSGWSGGLGVGTKNPLPFRAVGVGSGLGLQAELLEDTCALDIVQGFSDEVRPSYVWATTTLLLHVCLKDDLLAGVVVEAVTIHDVVDVAYDPLFLFGGELHAGAGCDVEQDGVCFHNEDQCR